MWLAIMNLSKTSKLLSQESFKYFRPSFVIRRLFWILEMLLIPQRFIILAPWWTDNATKKCSNIPQSLKVYCFRSLTTAGLRKKDGLKIKVSIPSSRIRRGRVLCRKSLKEE
jgi:hypothetical protein